ncbi:peptide/nickel transport system ATP-binding protein [Breoghania corrubedonensis]|uniref:Peptide/nickel transport system ATP-binding protein n=1 Tax=Breoghania corrubedonensis TaxID=665038 RepID=A0A2T5VA85_9HYPH|nr:oligopeptide/dipeptide ABC transporter ATP-binding protein [Breoghania corrubedonensis]PTW60641.1 peptide/nickel transport system ATP-binding protein [Breoghania corrubedonensis]
MNDLLQVDDLACHFSVRRDHGFPARRVPLKAVDGVSFSLAAGRTLALVGESGCGKSTTAKAVLGLTHKTGGDVLFKGAPLPKAGTREWRRQRQDMQLVFQDPLAALDRRLPIGRQIEEPLHIHGVDDKAQRRETVTRIMTAIGLKPHQAASFPHELSGGQRQRAVLARALVLEPSLLVLDEPISALDVSIQAQVINLLVELQERLGVAYLFISHDLKVVRQISHEVAVMYLGRIVEHGDPETIFTAPAHPYTRALVSAIPTVRTTKRERIILSGDPPNPIDTPPGCPFHTRCAQAFERCRIERPELASTGDGRTVACHLAHAPDVRAVA